ncbi:hypothetical protein DINM_007201 [Dirofilaria immitis]|nr:hypothetical protein [Dirofilaria immitis]
MREREQAVAKLSFEKEQMQTLNSRTGSPKRSSCVRSYSHGITDEFSGNEEVVVDGSKLLVPGSPDSCIDISSEFDNGKHDTGIPRNEMKENILEGNADDDVGVQRILNLISELQDLERSRTLAPCSPNLHCSECRGKLINL